MANRVTDSILMMMMSILVKLCVCSFIKKKAQTPTTSWLLRLETRVQESEIEQVGGSVESTAALHCTATLDDLE